MRIIWCYGSWNLRCDRKKYLPFWAVFCLFSPLTMQKIKILKLKKTPEDIIILHIWTINDNNMMHCSWDMEHDKQKFLLFWIVFCPFTSLWTQKINILKKWKQTWRYYHFTKVYHKWQSYDIWFLRYGVQRTKFFVILDRLLLFYSPNNLKNKNFEKHQVILSSYKGVPINGYHIMYGSWDTKCDLQNVL